MAKPAERLDRTEFEVPALAVQEPSEHEETFMHLERDQLVRGRQLRLPRAQLGKAAGASLWTLRIFVLVVSAMVIYTFVSQLHG